MPRFEDIDFRRYTQGFDVAAVYAKSVVQRLVNAAPSDADPRERRALDKAVAIADGIEAIRWHRTQSRRKKGIQRLRYAVMDRVVVLHDVLTGLATIPRELGDRGLRAAGLLASIFPGGTGFVTGDADVVWSGVSIRLAWIEAHGLRTEIAYVLGGLELLALLETSAHTLAEALGVGSAKRPPPRLEELREERAKLSRAIGAYCRLFAAKVEEDDDRSIERFVRAVAPLDEHRAAHARTAASEEHEDLDAEGGSTS